MFSFSILFVDLTNKKVIPYEIVNPISVDDNDSFLKKIQTLFEKKFSEFTTNVSLIAGLTFSCPSMLVGFALYSFVLYFVISASLLL